MADEQREPYLVVIGSSAGGVAALSTLVATLPAGFPAPIVLAQHLSPAHPSHLGDILARHTTLPVRTIAAREPLEPGVVFVVPADRHIEITDGHVGVPVEGAGRPKPSIDLLLSSAAHAYRDRLVAVVLTGTGSDGAAGARAVKQAGGTVVIQNPETASYPAMPRSLAPTTVDIVANLEDIGPLLHDLVTDAPIPGASHEEATLRTFLEEVRARSGIDFTSYKAPTIGRRLQRRMAATRTGTLADYRAYLHDHPEEYQRLISSFLIKVTEFFRDPELFSYLREQALPSLIDAARGRGNELRLWSAGCATGEEAYSLAILVTEVLGANLDRFTVRIFATDLDATAIDFARRGVYPASALSTLPEDLIARYFVGVDGAYEVVKRVRGLVVFGQHDLGQRPAFPRIDLALCRNVLIYFTPELQRRALQLFAFALRDGGYLALGKAEATGLLAEWFAPIHPELNVYRRQGERIVVPPARAAATTLSTPVRLTLGHPVAARREVRGGPGDAPGAGSVEAAEGVLSGFPLGAAVVDRRYDVRAINDAALDLLSIHQAAVGEDIIHLAQGVPSASLRAAIDAAFDGASPASVDEAVRLDAATGEIRYIRIACYPHDVATEGGSVTFVMVLVTDATVTEQAHRLQVGEMEQVHARQQEEMERVRVQAQQVATSNRELLAANRRLNQTIAELRRANETSLAGTQEAQAATEEVETLNEELQATNEELETLNEELQATIEELHTTNDDATARDVELREVATALEAQRARLAAILASVGDAVLVVDSTGRPVLTNAAYERLFGDAGAGVLVDEQGQPLPPEATPQQRAARGETFSMQCIMPARDPAGKGSPRYLEANGQPIRDGGDERGGVVVVRDVTERRLLHLQDEFPSSAAFARPS